MSVDDTLADFFGFDEHDTNLRTEVLAGLTTFLTMSYIVVVNPAILADSPQSEGFQDGIALANYSYTETVQMLAVVTIISAFVATFVMAVYANRPFAQAPGLGLNTFFAITVVGILGVPWQVALAAVVVEGVIFMVLTVAGARKFIIEAFPEPVKLSVGTGIGAFLALIGLEEMGVVVDTPNVLVGLGPVAQDPVATLAVVGLFITFGLYAMGVRGAIILGILVTTALGYGIEWIDGAFSLGLTAGTSLTAEVPGATYDITPLAGSFLEGLVGAPAANIDAFAFALIVFTFFFVDFFDTAGTLTGVGQIAGFLDDEGNLPEMEKPLMSDAIGTTVGGMLGTSTVTTYIESATGVEEGGRTGMTALVVSLLFLASLIVVPLAAAIPLYASHIALVVVAVIMLGNVTDIEWDDVTQAAPAGMTILVMPFTFNIGYGIAAGILTYPVVKIAVGEWNDVRPAQWVLALAFVVYFVVRTGGVLQGVA